MHSAFVEFLKFSIKISKICSSVGMDPFRLYLSVAHDHIHDVVL